MYEYSGVRLAASRSRSRLCRGSSGLLGGLGRSSFWLLAAGYLVDPVAALLVDELQGLQVQRLGLGEGQHLRDQGLAALGSRRK